MKETTTIILNITITLLTTAMRGRRKKDQLCVWERQNYDQKKKSRKWRLLFRVAICVDSKTFLSFQWQYQRHFCHFDDDIKGIFGILMTIPKTFLSFQWQYQKHFCHFYDNTKGILVISMTIPKAFLSFRWRYQVVHW